MGFTALFSSSMLTGVRLRKTSSLLAHHLPLFLRPPPPRYLHTLIEGCS